MMEIRKKLRMRSLARHKDGLAMNGRTIHLGSLIKPR